MSIISTTALITDNGDGTFSLAWDIGSGALITRPTQNNPTLNVIPGPTFAGGEIIMNGTGVGGLDPINFGCYEVNFQANGQSVANANMILEINGVAESFFLNAATTPVYLTVFADGALWSRTPCCVAASTRVETASGEQKTITELRRGDLLRDVEGREIPLTRNAAFTVPACDFVQMRSEQHGSHPLLIRDGHPVLEPQSLRECPCEALLGESYAERVRLDEPVTVHTLVTPRRTFVKMEGHWVATWAERDFEAAGLSAFTRASSA